MKANGKYKRGMLNLKPYIYVPLKHPVNLAYEAATTYLNDVI